MGWRLDKIISAFSEAASDPSKWTSAIDSVARETESAGALILPTTGRLPIVPSQSMARLFERYVSEGWIDRDDRYKVLPTILEKGVGTDLDIFTPEEIRRSDYYQEFLAPLGLRWFASIGVRADNELWGISIQRSIEQGPFQPDELRELARLSRELDSTATMARALGFARAEGTLTAFEISDTAAVMLNGLGQVLRTNRQAEKLLGEDIMILNRRLRSKRRAASDILDRAIHDVLIRADTQSVPAIALPREIGRAVIAHVIRADAGAMEVLSPARAFVLLVDPEKTITPALEDLSSVFGLTRAEGRLVIELQRGHSLVKAAERLNTTYETARSTLKQVFRKTDTSGQVDLLLLVSRLQLAI